jgi:hypothetical protein
MPDRMTVACARFFAADWEASSFLEFFVDLRLRVSEERGTGLGRTSQRLTDHSKFALQLTLLRSVDSYLAYLAEVGDIVAAPTDRRYLAVRIGWDCKSSSGVPADVGSEYWAALARNNVRLLHRLFSEKSGVGLFSTSEEMTRIERLVVLRNLIAHGRMFAADDLAKLVDETVSVREAGLRLRSFQDDLHFLRRSVASIDDATALRWGLDRPVERETLFRTLQSAAAAAERTTEPLLDVSDSETKQPPQCF